MQHFCSFPQRTEDGTTCPCTAVQQIALTLKIKLKKKAKKWIAQLPTEADTSLHDKMLRLTAQAIVFIIYIFFCVFNGIKHFFIILGKEQILYHREDCPAQSMARKISWVRTG